MTNDSFLTCVLKHAKAKPNQIIIKDKWNSFGWNTCEIDGNDMEEILNVLSAKPTKGVPTAVMLNTIKGKGVSFMEDNNNWHYRIPNIEEVKLAFNELGVEL
jgi:transketolase